MRHAATRAAKLLLIGIAYTMEDMTTAGLTDTLDDDRGHVLRARAASLEVTAGPDQGKRARLDRPVLVVGSGEAADLRLSDETVSREHVRLSLLPDGVHVRDEKSKNGTWLGAVRIESALLAGDALLTIGATSLAVRIDAEPSEIALWDGDRFGATIGVDGAMRHVFGRLARAAATDVAVLIEGEPGVGKGALARGVHQASARAQGPLVVVDCASLSEALLDDELFGHEPGLFEGTGEARAGAFELAAGGTLVLDEIDALGPDLQAKVDAALESKAARRAGASEDVGFDARIVATAQQPLAELVAAGAFRQELYYRLSVARVHVPPLRDRPSDVEPIATQFFRDALGDPNAELPVELASLLGAYLWPGNVQELHNVVLRFATLGARDREALFGSGAFASAAGMPSLEQLAQMPYHEARQAVLDRFEDAYLPSVLERAGGVVSKAAELAGIARPSFYRMVDRQKARKR